MMGAYSILAAEQLAPVKYCAIFIAALLEGPAVMMASGLLLKLGYVRPLPALVTLVSGDLAADLAWYAIGHWGLYRFLRRHAAFLDVSDCTAAKVRRVFARHEEKILLASKMTIGLGMAVPILITAGMTGVPLRKYLLCNLVGGLVLTPSLMAVGYSFGNALSLIDRDLRIGFLACAAACVLSSLYLLGRSLRKRIEDETL